MAACAHLFKEKGFDVEGGDSLFLPPMSLFLDSMGIPLYPLDKVDSRYLKKFDLIVVGNVVAKGSRDARLVEEAGVPLISYPKALGRYILSGEVVGVAGTHGKTTTTYLMIQLFEKMGMNPGYFIGGMLEGRPPSSLGDGNFFFIEADEYDSAWFDKAAKFRHYNLDHIILTSLEFDHADIFSDIEAVKDEFRAVFPRIKKGVFNVSWPSCRDLFHEYEKKLEEIPCLYGGDKGPFIEKENEKGTVFSLNMDETIQVFTSDLVGIHNIHNLSAALLFAHSRGLSIEGLKKACRSLKLPHKRQTLRGRLFNAMMIDDFAHHPHAISATITAVRTKYPGKKLLAIVEPSSATARSDLFQEEYAESVKDADHVVWVKPLRDTTVPGRSNLDCSKLVMDLKEKNILSCVVDNLDELKKILHKECKKEIICLVMSNGSCFGLWESGFVKDIKK